MYKRQLEDPDIKAIGFVGSTPIAEYIYTQGCAHGKRVQCFGGAKNHMIVMPDAPIESAADALIGSAFGAAGERCMAISVAVAVGDEVADELVAQLKPRVESLKIEPGTVEGAEMGPLITGEHRDKVSGYVDIGVEEGADLVVDGREFKHPDQPNGSSWVAACSTGAPPTCAFTRKRSSDRCWSWFGRRTTTRPWRW